MSNICGIAGYNVSQKWCEEYITSSEIQKELLQESWLHNLHRGGDAAGYMALKDDDKIKVYKNEGPADELLEKNLKSTRVPVSRVFGAHTRAKTKGEAKVQANNHPVYFGGVFVTHNGTIRNDGEIKKQVPADRQDTLPEVDSVAIPIVLSQAGSPYEADVLADLLADLDGGFAFHAMWREYPGVSVMAKGTGSPLIFAIHDYGAVLYASEVEALWGMISAMELNAKDEAWKYYSLKANAFIVVEDGRPIAWDGFTPPSSFNRTADQKLFRMLPDAGENGGPEIVYSTDLNNDFAVKHGVKGRDLGDVAEDEQEVLYKLDEGILEGKETFPQRNDFSKYSVFSEADKIIKNKRSGNYHVFFGDVEIISNGRTVCDVYDHGKFTTDQRWIVEDKEDEEEAAEIVHVTFDDFIDAEANRIVQTPDPDAIYKFKRRYTSSNVIDMRNRAREHQTGGVRRQLPLPETEGEAKIPGTIIPKPEGGDDMEYLKPEPLLTYDNIWDDTVDHENREMSNDGFVFLGKSQVCYLHGERPLWRHYKPDECKACVAAAAYTLSCVANLKLLSYVLANSKLTEFEGDYSIACDEADDHEWFGSLYAEIHLKSGKYFDIVIGEECVYCRATREIGNLPWWLIQIIARKKDVMFYSC